jgi:hypothetical protein
MTDDLIKRLQDWVPAEAPPEGRTAPDAVADMRQAADRIEALSVEIERLREALEAAPIIGLREGLVAFKFRQDEWLKTKYREALEKQP